MRKRINHPRHPEHSPNVLEVIADILQECWDAKVPDGPLRFQSPKKQELAKKIRAKKLDR